MFNQENAVCEITAILSRTQYFKTECAGGDAWMKSTSAENCTKKLVYWLLYKRTSVSDFIPYLVFLLVFQIEDGWKQVLADVCYTFDLDSPGIYGHSVMDKAEH